jgi:hypothetical protein
VPANCGVAGGECSVVLLAADLPAEVHPSVLAWQECFAQLELHHTAIQLPAQLTVKWPGTVLCHEFPSCTAFPPAAAAADCQARCRASSTHKLAAAAN